MPDPKRKKRERIREFLSLRGPGPPVEEKTGPHRSPGAGEPPTHTLTTASSTTSVPILVAGPTTQTTIAPASSTRRLIARTKSTPLTSQLGGAIGDATFKSNPRSQPGPISSWVAAMDRAHTEVENEGEHNPTAAGSIQGQSLWGKAINSNELSPWERKTLADTDTGIDGRETASAVDAIRSIMNGILKKKKGELWKVKFRGEEVVLRDVGMKILRWVDTFKRIGDIIAQYDPLHAALPWAGFRFLLQMCLNKQESVYAILVGLEKIACLINRCAIYETLCIDISAASKNLENSILRLYTAILKFFAKAIRMLNDNFIKAVFTGAISDYLDEVQVLEQTVGQDAAVAEAQCSRAEFEKHRALLDDINGTALRLGYQIDDIQQSLEGPKRSEILEWISNIPYTSHHQRISEGRLKGTGEWLFERGEYRTWRSLSTSKLLLLRGIPGAGKTYIASAVIDSLLSSPEPEKLVYFYCSRAEENRRDPLSILNTLIQQLAQTESGKNELLKPVVDIYLDRESRGQRSSHLSILESQELLIQLTDIYPQMTICIDALDEVETETRLLLLKALKNTIEKSKNLVKVFATTRMDTDILRQFAIFPRIELLPDDNIDDINLFVETKLQSAIDDGLLLQGDVSDELKDEICDALCKRSRGMFQLAALQIDFICKMPTPNNVRRGLEALPDTLKDAYSKIYKRILDQNGNAPGLALSAFRWIQCSYEPLCSETLLDAIMVEIDDEGKFSRKDTITVDGLLKICQNLLIFDKQLNVFRFAHLSVDEYLETELPKVDSHSEIAMVCLSLLCTPSSWDTYDKTLKTRKGRHSDRHLLLYSAVFWPWHFSLGRDTKGYQILTYLCNKLMSETDHQRWLDYHHLTVKPSSWTSDFFWLRVSALQHERSDPLHSACVFGLRRMFTTMFKSKPLMEGACISRLLLPASQFGDLEIVSLLIDGGADVSVTDKWGSTPLHAAAKYGHEAMARLLTGRGADVSAADNDGLTPPHVAAKFGHQAAARLFIDRGANISAADKLGSTPLHAAAKSGHEEMAQLLIDRGADISAADKLGLTPLHATTRFGHEAMARLLIDRGADPSVVDRFGQTLLHHAAESGREAVARLFLDRGADISATNKWGSTPLHAAAEFGHEAMARFLIDRGADASTANNDGSTPLHVAAMCGHEAVVRLLIDEGADPSVVDEFGRTPLHKAVEFGHEAAAQLLIDRGADVSAADKRGSTPLHVAAVRRHEAAAKLLIDRGSNISAADNDGSTPLHAAVVCGHEAVARLLIDRGADASAVDWCGQTLLHQAAEFGHEAAARLFLDRGADISATNKWGSTPLHVAAVCGHEAVVRLLIGKGADPSVVDEYGRTPLHNAAEFGREAAAQQFIDRGADITAADKQGLTPLHAAAKSGHEAMARLLIDRGADPSVVDEYGQTPLYKAALFGHEAVAQLLRRRGVTGTQLIAVHAPTFSL